MTDDALFEVAPLPRLQEGDRVRVTTMWGEETGVVLDVHDEDGFPMVKLRLDSGDTVSLCIARVVREPK